ncbi:hypothetical protein [Cylindrospermum stagnale]|uniref:hypothetical protein n=1 Tax=Cylindrospermum stagnale TaxID=142864 RepID=UPI001C1169E2|nr:hypothetical protein [Cylindrospermum stagnale]
MKQILVILNHILGQKLIFVLLKAGCLLGVLSFRVFSTHVHIMVQKINSGSLFDAKFYFTFSRKAYFAVTYGSFYGSHFSPSYGSSHRSFNNSAKDT